MSTLDSQIEQARLARLELEKLEELKRQADELPKLLEEQRLQGQREAAMAEVERARCDAAGVLADAKSRLPELDARIHALAQEARAIVSEVNAIERQIFRAGRNLQGRVDAHASIGWQWDRTKPAMLQDNGGAKLFGQSWQQAGGGDKALALAMPDKELEKYLDALGLTGLYRPAAGPHNFTIRI